MHAGNYGWIELVLFYGIAISFGLWQYFSMDRKLKRTRAEKAAKEAAKATAKQEDAPSG